MKKEKPDNSRGSFECTVLKAVGEVRNSGEADVGAIFSSHYEIDIPKILNSEFTEGELTYEDPRTPLAYLRAVDKVLKDHGISDVIAKVKVEIKSIISHDGVSTSEITWWWPYFVKVENESTEFEI